MVFSLFPVCSNQKKDAVWLLQLQAAHLCLSVWVFWISLLSNFTCECINPVSSHLPALAAQTNTARLMQDQVMMWKAMVQKRRLSSYLFYIFKCFVVFSLSFLDFQQTAISFVIFCHSHFLEKGKITHGQILLRVLQQPAHVSRAPVQASVRANKHKFGKSGMYCYWFMLKETIFIQKNQEGTLAVLFNMFQHGKHYIFCIYYSHITKNYQLKNK